MRKKMLHKQLLTVDKNKQLLDQLGAKVRIYQIRKKI